MYALTVASLDKNIFWPSITKIHFGDNKYFTV